MTYQWIIALFYGPCCSTLFKPCVYLGFINHPIQYPIFLLFQKNKSLTMPFFYDFNHISCLTQYSRVKIISYVMFYPNLSQFPNFSYVTLKILREFKTTTLFNLSFLALSLYHCTLWEVLFNAMERHKVCLYVMTVIRLY
jgi:hypothetical protein